jgi:hypothetical protein
MSFVPGVREQDERAQGVVHAWDGRKLASLSAVRGFMLKAIGAQGLLTLA